MKKQNNISFSRICLLAGIILMTLAIVTLLVWQLSARVYEKRAAEYAETIFSLIPEPEGAVPESRRDNTMSSLLLDGNSFVGILEMPRYSLSLPVGANWGKTFKFPCLFDGSVYNSSLQIGATSQKGQFDFYREISVGDSVLFTDMEGNRFSFTVTDLRYTQHASASALAKHDSPLKIFIKNTFAFEYLIIFCDVLN